jgi:hypothetical protein
VGHLQFSCNLISHNFHETVILSGAHHRFIA